jgi:hypothetical protein
MSLGARQETHFFPSRTQQNSENNNRRRFDLFDGGKTHSENSNATSRIIRKALKFLGTRANGESKKRRGLNLFYNNVLALCASKRPELLLQCKYLSEKSTGQRKS